MSQRSIAKYVKNTIKTICRNFSKNHYFYTKLVISEMSEKRLSDLVNLLNSYIYYRWLLTERLSTLSKVRNGIRHKVKRPKHGSSHRTISVGPTNVDPITTTTIKEEE